MIEERETATCGNMLIDAQIVLRSKNIYNYYHKSSHTFSKLGAFLVYNKLRHVLFVIWVFCRINILSDDKRNQILCKLYAYHTTTMHQKGFPAVSSRYIQDISGYSRHRTLPFSGTFSGQFCLPRNSIGKLLNILCFLENKCSCFFTLLSSQADR